MATGAPIVPPAALPPERPGYPAPADLAARREGLAGAVASGLWRTDPAPAELILGGVRCLLHAPAMPAHGTVLHFHGGAFRLGCPEQLGPFAARLAERCGVNVVCPAYRLAPEHPFPAGLVDGCRVLSALNTPGHLPVVLSGDSAGGGLAAGLAALAGQSGSKPAGLVLLSAWLDLTVTAPGYITNAASDPLFSADSANTAAELYLQGHAAKDPVASPLHGIFDNYPPTLVNIGSGEVLLDDARLCHGKLTAAGIAAQLHEVAGMDHVAVTRDSNAPGAAETFEAIAAFIDTLLAAGA